MKPYRNNEWQLSGEDSNAIRNEIYKELDFAPVSWHERQELQNKLTPQEYDKWQEEYQEKYAEFNDLWREKAVALAEVGQVQTNIRNNQLDAFCLVFQRADRILTGLANCLVEVSDEKTEIPAWSDGKSVTFNVSSIKEIDETTLSSLHGLNYHEVAHLLYTPRVGTELGAWVKEVGTPVATTTFNTETERWEQVRSGDERIRYAFNLLEDFRAENYLITKYPSVSPFLQAVVADYAITAMSDGKYDEADLDSVFILLAGRPHFPNELIRLSAVAYAKANGAEATRLFYNLSNEYRTLVFPRDYARAKEIIEQVAKYLPKMPKLPSGCGDRPVLRNGRVATQTEQDKLSQQSQMSDQELQEMFDQLMSGEQVQSDNAGEQNSPNDSQSEGENSQGNSDSPTSSDSKAISEALANELEELVTKVLEDKAVQKKVDETNKAIRKQSGNKTILTRQARSLETPTQADVMAVRTFTQELERLRIDSDPDWDREKPTGKLNVRRAMQADVNDINKLFDRWDTGNDDYDIEAVVLLDRSGSMYGSMDSASKASWIIKRSLEKINANVSVITFNDTSRLLYSSEEKAPTSFPSVQATGGTDPYYGLVEAERIMLASKRKTKLLFLLTDGQFYGGKTDDVIERIKALDVHTNLTFLASSEHWVEWAKANSEQVSHNVHDFRFITKPLDLVKVAKDVVRYHLRHA